MAQSKLEVLYRDGHTEQVLVTANAMWDVEEKFGNIADGKGVRASIFLAWASLRDAGRESADLDTWRREKVAWVEEMPDEAVTDKDVDPTPAATSSTGSADSPS